MIQEIDHRNKLFFKEIILLNNNLFPMKASNRIENIVVNIQRIVTLLLFKGQFEDINKNTMINIRARINHIYLKKIYENYNKLRIKKP